MNNLLEFISIHGFRSIKKVVDLKIGPLTVLVGANGAGKSNLVGFFRMLNYMMTGGLKSFVRDGNGAANLLHFGQKTTRFIGGELSFGTKAGSNRYAFELTWIDGDRLAFVSERIRFHSVEVSDPQEISLPLVTLDESQLSRPLGDEQKTEKTIKAFVSTARVFHFHDTSNTANIRTHADVADNLWLKSDGGNLAAILLRLREEYPSNYRRIVTSINTVFPEFQDFVLEPTGTNGGAVMLRWRGTSSPEFLFTTNHTSDGTLRFMALATLFSLPSKMAPRMILMDEPELGLHPAAESVLASLIRAASRSLQVLLSTQSATLVDHFTPEEVVVVEMHEGASQFRRLDSSELVTWLKNYRLGEIWRKNVFGGRSGMNLFIYVEGQEEEMFVNRVLRNHLYLLHGAVVQKPILAATSWTSALDATVGGVTNYRSIHQDILSHYEDGRIKAGDALTTLVDLYALPPDFPGHPEANAQELKASAKADFIEKAWKAAIETEVGAKRFFPYIQVNEFEALVLSRPTVLEAYHTDRSAGIALLSQECAPFRSPEDINELKETSPSHRILAKIPEYVKENAWRLLQDIGLQEIRAHCHRFDRWLTQCESGFP